MTMHSDSFVMRVVLLALLIPSGCKERAPGVAATDHEHSHAHEEAHSGHEGHAAEVTLTAEAVDRHGIKIETAARHTLAPSLLAPARVSYNMEAMAHVGSPLRGRVSELSARLGDAVRKGDVLLVIESPDLGEAQSEFLQKRTAAETARPAVELARNASERAKALYDKSQGIALTEVQKRHADYQMAQAALLAAQTAAVAAENRLHLLGMDQHAVESLLASGEIQPRLAITAPIHGQVIEREVTTGELVSPDRDALLILANLETLWVLADVPEGRLQDIAVGHAARVTVGTGQGVPFAGEVSFISPAINPSTRSARVRIEVRDARLALRPGMFARAEIETRTIGAANEPVLAVPEEAIQTIGGGAALFVPVQDEPNTFAVRTVIVGRSVRGLVPILGGLVEGEPLVAAGSFILKAELGKSTAEHQH